MIMDLARTALGLPVVYNSYQSLVGAPQCHQRFIADMISCQPTDRVLDIGCGVGASVRYLPKSVDYVGIDISAPYIAKARRDFPGRGEFLCMDVSVVNAANLGKFDRAFAFGVLHHLSDDVAAQLVELVRAVVKSGGQFVSIDPCYVPGQNPIAKLLIDNDRGEYIRDENGFRNIVTGLGKTSVAVHHDLLRVPYTQIVMTVDLD